MLRKWILENRSQQYRQLSQVYKESGNSDILSGGIHLVSGVLSGDQLTGAVKGWQGGSKIGDGFQKRAIGSDYEEMANRLQAKAEQSKWWDIF